MKRYILTSAAAFSHVPDQPDRTAHRACRGAMNFDREFQIWPSRLAMLTTIRMQERGEPSPYHWRACNVPTPPATPAPTGGI